MKMEQQHELELHRQVDVGNTMIGKLQDQIGVLETRDCEFAARVRELEGSIARLSKDAEAAQGTVRDLRDELSEKDRLLRVARTSLDAAEKQNQHQMSQVFIACNYTVSQKNVPPLTCYRLYIHGSIATVFCTNVAEKVGTQNVLCLPTSPN